MKTALLYIVFSLFFFSGVSQNLTCCKTISEVKSLIKGDWKLKGDSKNVVYRFSFSEDKGFIEALKEMNLPPKAEKPHNVENIINHHEIFSIKSKQGIFSVVIQGLNYEMVEQIFALNETSFIYGKGNSRRVFIKDRN